MIPVYTKNHTRHKNAKQLPLPTSPHVIQLWSNAEKRIKTVRLGSVENTVLYRPLHFMQHDAGTVCGNAIHTRDVTNLTSAYLQLAIY